MISDNDLYTLAIFLGSCAMLLIVLYHFLEVNAEDDSASERTAVSKAGATTGGIPTAGGKAVLR